MFPREMKRASKNGTQVSYLQVITYTGPAGTFQQRTEFTAAQRDIYTTLEPGTPKKIIEGRPRAADQPQHRRLVTHRSGVLRGISAGQHPNPRTSRSS